MQRDKDTNMFIKEMGSYEVEDGSEYITKMYYDGEKINLNFDTKDDVQEWEYSAIFDLFNEEAFHSEGYEIESVDDEYNPTWLVKFDYDEEHNVVESSLKKLCSIIKVQMLKVFEDIKGQENNYI